MRSASHLCGGGWLKFIQFRVLRLMIMMIRELKRKKIIVVVAALVLRLVEELVHLVLQEHCFLSFCGKTFDASANVPVGIQHCNMRYSNSNGI